MTRTIPSTENRAKTAKNDSKRSLGHIPGLAIYEPSLGQKYRVSGYPTIYVLDGSDDVVDARHGEASRDVYEARIEKAPGSGG